MKFIVSFLSSLLFSVGVMAAPTFITIGSGSTTGVYYPVAVGVAKLINKDVNGVRANARSTGGSVYNALSLQRGNLKMAIMQSDIAYYAYHGQVVKAFLDQPIKSLRGVAALYPEVVQIVANPAIHSITGLKDKRVYIGDIGSGVEQNAKQILALYGLSEKDITPIRGSASLGAQLLQDGRIDAMFYTAGVGSAAIQQITETTKVRFLPVLVAQATALIKRYPFYTAQQIPAGSYKGQTAAIPAVAVEALLVASSDLPNKVVQAIIDQGLFKQGKIDQFVKLHANLKAYFKLNQAVEGIGIPLHAGAIAAYKALGVPGLN
ncbi:TRAP transporter solute receptor, TAXI family [Piscirickettsia salmonis]|uniref:TAXI family TRAP transporter solute-binding subunit n=1 Tax=Piscirickettsia salmonis TaxID=1238 RepID=UPI0012BB1333|nr:TAXI family TRAP transporter solute-binding subunit [Piscirickettsia salmonis]QGP53991.1 TRAP transporter solute receptor, TAXI family [Piscirickettsia salmonis]QGP60110.1 TRAP transporter solute receptor, TAXI family [Piscirickettsia salmonis]QGP63567.1 TRAP transporter solute receptor, TAXI family [Piscirickettsia salmonis]